MGILGSMITGVTGLSAQGNALDIIGDNISNISTNGFKNSRGEFADMVSRNLKGIEGGNQIGRGTQLRSVTPIFVQGSLIRTERPTDISINGDGFFVTKASDGGQMFTRDGSMRFNKEGHLVTMDGHRVQGYVGMVDGRMSPELSDISIPTNAIPAVGTKKINMHVNLDARAAAPIKQFDPTKPADSCNFSTGISVYDTKGSAHIVTVYFNKVTENKWDFHALCDGSDILGGVKGVPVEEATGSVEFDIDGRLAKETVTKSSFNFTNGAQPNQYVDFDFGDSLAEQGTGVAGTTQYGTDSVLYKFLQDGYQAGVLSSLSINEEGTITGLYSNGITRDLAQLCVAKFENNEGLTKAGANMYRESKLSGGPFIGKPGQNGRGTMLAKSLEQSTTDLAGEFVSMIQAQRGFQANAKIISTTDELLNDVIALKR